MWILLIIAGLAIQVSCDRPSVSTGVGVIQGVTLTTTFKGQDYVVDRYAGIRFAKPPVGLLRFQKPQPYGAFAGGLDASNFTSPCPQFDSMNMGLTSADEDCLSLNVYVPTMPTTRSGGFAVMVFIHGGGFSMGGSVTAPSEGLAGVGEVIVVTINYRLGPLGFANTGDGLIPGNMAFWDQRLALQWTKDHIASFGGDDSSITIFGQSAGGISVCLQGMYPPNGDLFQNIIAESGTPGLTIGFADDNLVSIKVLAEANGCPQESTEQMVRCLQQADIATFMTKLQEVMSDPTKRLSVSFRPTRDGEFLRRDPVELIKEAEQHTAGPEITYLRSKRLINGINSAEGGMWLFMLGPSALQFTATAEKMKSTHIPMMLSMTVANGRPIPDAILKLASGQYTNWDDPSDARNMYIKFIGDILFSATGVAFSSVHANSSTSRGWLYNFRAETEKHLLMHPDWMQGANHGDELPAVFGYQLSAIGELPNRATYNPPDWELDLSERVMAYWSNFAKYGNPNGKEPNPQIWPRYSTATNNQYHIFDHQDSTGDNLYKREVEFWQEVVPLVWESIERDGSKCPQRSDSCDAHGVCN